LPLRGLRVGFSKAGGSEQAKVLTSPGKADIVVTGRPRLWGAYGPPSPGAFERCGFATQRFNSTLLVATSCEYVYIHFGIVIEDLAITIPPGVEVEREFMVVNGDMKPDLRAPGAPPREGPRP
jgi:hypothetical protein